jgi:S1-C subfamily serine protease
MEEKKPGFFKRVNKKVKITCGLALIALLLLCCGATAFAWYAGYIKEAMCKSVLEKSDIWNNMQCQSAPKQVEQNITDNYQVTYKTVLDEEVITDVVNKAIPAVVSIGISTANEPNQVIGTGFFVSRDGLIATNRHVVENEKIDFKIMLNDTDNISVEQKQIFRDPLNDVALIKLNEDQLPRNFKYLPLGDSDNLLAGQTVIAIGNPLGEYYSTVTKGIISGLGREVKIGNGFNFSKDQVYRDVIQTDAAINPGNSGGPLIDGKGKVIGINFATVNGADNLSFAIPINRLKNRINELAQYGKFKLSYIGIEYISKLVFIKGQSMVGAQIATIAKDSPAEKSGLVVGDIVVSFNGMDLNNKGLFVLIQEAKIGDKVKVVVLRNSVTTELEVVIGEK